MKKQSKGITLVALVITIIILLILAGIAISTLNGENGLIAKVNQAKKAQIEAEMKEKLVLAINELQTEKEGSATIGDITQEWANEKLNEYSPEVKDANDEENQEKTITLTKSGFTEKYKIKADLTIEEIDLSEIILEYEIGTKEGDKVNISIKISSEEVLNQIITPKPDIIDCNGKKEVGIEYKVQYGVEYIFTIITESGKEKQEKILILPENDNNTGLISETEYKINNETLKFAKIVTVGESQECSTVKEAFDYLYDNGYKENGAILLREGSYDTSDLHTGNSYNINPKYNEMSVSIIADSPGKTFMTSGEMVMIDNSSSYFIKLKFYRIIFKLPVYSDAGSNGFVLNADTKINEYYNCVFLPPVGGYNRYCKRCMH